MITLTVTRVPDRYQVFLQLVNGRMWLEGWKKWETELSLSAAGHKVKVVEKLRFVAMRQNML